MCNNNCKCKSKNFPQKRFIPYNIKYANLSSENFLSVIDTLTGDIVVFTEEGILSYDKNEAKSLFANYPIKE